MAGKGKSLDPKSNPAAKRGELRSGLMSKGASALSRAPRSGAEGISAGLPGKTVAIDESSWDKVYTYYFAVRDADEDTGEVTGSLSEKAKALFTDGEIEMPLLLPPQAIAVSSSFASSVVATNRGIVEENNGSIFKTLVISGTTGILPSKETLSINVAASLGIGKIAATLFPSAVNAIGSFINNAKRTVNGVENLSANASSVQPTTTGYYQFWRLHNFLQEYANLKSKKGFGNVRLLFVSPKDGIAYIVTPASFDLRRDSTAPGEYRYSIGLKSWGVATPTGEPPKNPYNDELPNRDRPLTVKGALEKIRRARQTIQAGTGIIRGVQSDIFDIMNTMNQGILALKDIVGAGNTVLDFLPTIKSNAEHLITLNKRQWRQVLEERREILAKYEGSSSWSSAIQSASSNRSSQAQTSPTGEADSGDSANPAALKLIGTVLDDAEVADDISLKELSPLPRSVAIQITKQIEEAKGTTATEVADLTVKLQEVSDNLAYASGLMDPVYAETYGLPAPTEAARPPNEDDILLAASIEEAKTGFLSTLASGNMYHELPDNPFHTANGYIPDDEEMPTPISSYAYTVTKGDTLERIALNLLDDANRAREIAILNELRSPYIDEIGFNQPISLAAGRSFVVTDRSKLVIGMTIKIGGTGVSSIRRKIVNIEDIGGGSFKVTVNGKSTSLNLYTSAVSPFLSARLPGTVGSGDTILIPSDDAPDAVQGTRSTPLSERLSFAEKVFLVDVALDKDGDLDFDASGDTARSYGYQNAAQALKLLILTEKGELQLHPRFGLDAAVGQRFDGPLLEELTQRVKAAVLNDPRFSDAIVSVTRDGTAIRVSIEAVGRRGAGRIPVEFKITV